MQLERARLFYEAEVNRTDDDDGPNHFARQFQWVADQARRAITSDDDNAEDDDDDVMKSELLEPVD